MVGKVGNLWVLACSFFDLDCVGNPWSTGDSGGTPFDPDVPDDDENWQDLLTTCPVDTSSSFLSTKTTTTATPTPSPSQGDPMQNKVKCYNSGETTEHDRVVNAAASFCGDIKRDVLAENHFLSIDYPFPYNGGLGTVIITISFQIKPKCSLNYDYNLCTEYLSVPDDSCYGGGINWKQGDMVSNDCYSFRIDPNLSL
jgi:hypothetical protein